MPYMGNLVGNARWEINLGFAGSQNAQKFIDTRVNTFRKTWSNYRKHKRYIDFAAKTVLTEF
jgi:hypothetical protein